MSSLNIVSLAHKECGECSAELWGGAEELHSISHCLCLVDVLKHQEPGLAFGGRGAFAV